MIRRSAAKDIAMVVVVDVVGVVGRGVVGEVGGRRRPKVGKVSHDARFGLSGRKGQIGRRKRMSGRNSRLL